MCESNDTINCDRLLSLLNNWCIKYNNRAIRERTMTTIAIMRKDNGDFDYSGLLLGHAKDIISNYNELGDIVKELNELIGS